MVSAADYFSMDEDDLSSRRMTASMAILDAVQSQINVGNLPGVKPGAFFMSVQLEDGKGSTPLVFPLYNNTDPVIIGGLMMMAQNWWHAIINSPG